MRKLWSLLLIVVLSMSVFTPCASAATMYSLDGRTIEVANWEIEAYRQVNWYYGKPTTMYAPDGRTLTIGENDVEAYENVGWYWGKPVTMYNWDGTRTLIIGENRVELYKSVGWFYGKPVTMYAKDGRTLLVGENEVEAYKNVGWYEKPFIKVYAPNITEDEVHWFADPEDFVKVLSISENELEAYKNVGWYETYSEALYTATFTVAKICIENNDYFLAIEFLQNFSRYMDEPYRGWSLSYIPAIENMWIKEQGSVLVLTGPHIYYLEDEPQLPRVSLNMVNLDSRHIVSFKIEFDCYDENGNPAVDIYGSNHVVYYAANTWCCPYDEEYPQSTIGGLMYIDGYELYNIPNTREVRNVKVTEILFSDGTKWTR